VRVKLGDTALIEVDAYLDRKFIGIVTQIANSSTSDPANADQVTNFKVKIRVLQSSYADLTKKDKNISPFRPGMSASVDILTNYKSNVISVSIQAVTSREDTSNIVSKGRKDMKPKKESSRDNTEASDDESSTIKTEKKEVVDEYVFVLNGKEVVLRKVKTGIQDDDHFEIMEGLKVGDKVISAPYRAISKTLKNHDKVEVVDKDKLFDK